MRPSVEKGIKLLEVFELDTGQWRDCKYELFEHTDGIIVTRDGEVYDLHQGFGSENESTFIDKEVGLAYWKQVVKGHYVDTDDGPESLGIRPFTGKRDLSDDSDEIPDDERMKYEKLILCDLRGLQYEVYHEHLNKRLEKIQDKKEKEKKKLEKEQNNNKKESNKNNKSNKSNKNDSQENNKNNSQEKNKNNTVVKSITNILGPSIVQIGNIVFPTDTGGGTFGAGGFDDNGSGAFEKVIQTQLGKKFTQYKYRQHAIVNLGTKQEKPFLDLSVLEQSIFA